MPGTGENQDNAPGGAIPQPGLDLSWPHPARVYDYWLGGKDNFAIDGRRPRTHSVTSRRWWTMR